MSEPAPVIEMAFPCCGGCNQPVTHVLDQGRRWFCTRCGKTSPIKPPADPEHWTMPEGAPVQLSIVAQIAGCQPVADLSTEEAS